MTTFFRSLGSRTARGSDVHDFQMFDHVQNMGYDDNVYPSDGNTIKSHHVSLRIKYHDLADLNLIVLLWLRLLQSYTKVDANFLVNLSVLIGVSLNFMAKVLRRSFPHANHYVIRLFYVVVGIYVLLADTVSNAYFQVIDPRHEVLDVGNASVDSTKSIFDLAASNSSELDGG